MIKQTIRTGLIGGSALWSAAGIPRSALAAPAPVETPASIVDLAYPDPQATNLQPSLDAARTNHDVRLIVGAATFMGGMLLPGRGSRNSEQVDQTLTALGGRGLLTN